MNTSRPVRLLASLGAAALLPVGLGLVALASLQADEGGYFSTSERRFATAGSALKTDEIDVGSSSAHAADPSPDIGEIARVRIVVASADPNVPLFVGIGPKDEVERYLKGSAYDDFVSAQLKPFRADFRHVSGAARPAPPTSRTFWVASSTGTGTRTLKWDKTHGAWSVVVMRMDGKPNVDAKVSMGLRFGFLVPLGPASLIGGGLLATFAILSRRKPHQNAPRSEERDHQDPESGMRTDAVSLAR
ncbi:hypothetical protein [Actinomadura rudentiformis]|uniref:Uncharacterized protein n=1 Tax=Actinomadura rudentiformis TaxID=359158 RepID=A0A6H9YI91_9ACTN|nr:hypothetical protein [Actinomadura rudentiformis]KAB2345649.1 hypothetical protein F8566_27325 [Actinomadura rudentiformis]